MKRLLTVLWLSFVFSLPLFLTGCVVFLPRPHSRHDGVFRAPVRHANDGCGGGPVIPAGNGRWRCQ